MTRIATRRALLERENAELRAKLQEAEDTLHAIQNLEVDAIVARTDHGDRVFSLAGAETPYRILVEAMNEGAATLSQARDVLYANACFAQMLQSPLEAVIGAKISRFISSERLRDFETHLERGKQGGVRVEFELLSAAGVLIPVYLSISPVEIEGVPTTCLVATDLKDQKLLERSQREIEMNKLERDLRVQLISALSHDLRTPLSTAKAAAEMILRFPGKLEMRENLAHRLLAALNRIDLMIRDLLDSGQIAAGVPLPLRITCFDLREMITAIVSDLKLVHGDRLILNSEDVVQGFWDWNELRRAIENLANNAVKYSNKNSTITITVRQDEERVWIALHNEGNPIPPNEQADLFSSVSTMKISKSGERGWKIGLVLVQGVVNAHGGTVRVESSSQSGTTFTIEIPRDVRGFQTKAA